MEIVFAFVVELLADWQRGRRMGSSAEYAAMTLCCRVGVVVPPSLLVNINWNKRERKGGSAVMVVMWRRRRICVSRDNNVFLHSLHFSFL